MKHHINTLIIGSGPTGLGAARQLETLGFHDWALLEAEAHAGGLASSFVDDKGFVWDIGGHVQFSHYEYFDQAMREFLGADGWIHHERESWVWMRERFIPYPFQNNIRMLPKDDLAKCLRGLVDITRASRAKPTTFREWVDATFGPGIADVFMTPYNKKVWAYPLEKLSANWMGERVAVTDLARILDNLVFEKDDLSWGPNNTFQFPRFGGTGAIWRACAMRLPQDKLNYNSRVSRIDLDRHDVHTADGTSFKYETLISTLSLKELIRLSGQEQLAKIADRGLLHSNSNIVGLGLRGAPSAELAKNAGSISRKTIVPSTALPYSATIRRTTYRMREYTGR